MPASSTRDRIIPEADVRPLRRPEWIKVRAPAGENYERIQTLMRSKSLHTVCEEAMCPNLGECWGSGTATFLMLGDVCTRTCAFCDIKHGKPTLMDWGEAERVAQAVKSMDLKHAVITSVNRDELDDGGASMFVETIREIRHRIPTCAVEVLIPDFEGNEAALAAVASERPDILNHNIETVRRLFPSLRPQGKYARSIELLGRAKHMGARTKSGLIVGMGETMDEIREVMTDLRAVGCDILTIGQYLQPTKGHLAVVRFYEPAEFASLKEEGLALGFSHVESGPLVRSSYHAEQQSDRLASH